jgi:hypothetical protein
MSKRNATITILLLVFALIPTINGFYSGLPEITSLKSNQMPTKVDELKGNSTRRSQQNVNSNFKSNDWTERYYTDPSGTRVKLFIARGYDSKPFFHYPENALLNRNWSERYHNIVTWFENKRVHELVLSGVTENQKAYYVLLYGNKIIGKPYLFFLKQIPNLILSKRQPFTLILVSYSESEDTPDILEDAKKLMLTALKHMRAES